MFFTRLEFMTIMGIGAAFVVIGQNETATTVLPAGLAVPGIYLWMARSEA